MRPKTAKLPNFYTKTAFANRVNVVNLQVKTAREKAVNSRRRALKPMLLNFIKRALRRRFDFADRAELKSAVNLRRFKAAAKFVVF